MELDSFEDEIYLTFPKDGNILCIEGYLDDGDVLGYLDSDQKFVPGCIVEGVLTDAGECPSKIDTSNLYVFNGDKDVTYKYLIDTESGLLEIVGW